jgi:AAA domain
MGWTDADNPFEEPKPERTDRARPDLWDAADVLNIDIPPREWLLSTIFCKGFTSSLIGAGAGGKTAVRIAQALSVAIGRPLTGEYVHKQAKVLFLCFEDGKAEFQRRIKAALMHHKISDEEIRGRLMCSAILGEKLFADSGINRATPRPTALYDWLVQMIKEYGFELIILDPFVKIHQTEENDNTGIDQVCSMLSHLAVELNIAVDHPYHVRKGGADPGDAEIARGASAAKDAGRLGYTLTPMTAKMAEACGVTNEALRRSLVRQDSAKVNIAPPTIDTIWFRLIGVPIGNPTTAYPHGDNVHTIERWRPLDPAKDLPIALANEIVDAVDKGPAEGRRYSDAPQSDDRAAWKVVRDFCPGWTEKQCKTLIDTWVENGTLIATDYHDPVFRRKTKGLYVGTRPGSRF